MAAKKDGLASEYAVTPGNARELIELSIYAQQPAFIWGPPGIGKSELVEAIAVAQDRIVIDMRLLLMEPTDLKGIPYYNPEDKMMRWAQPADLPATVTEADVDAETKVLEELKEQLKDILEGKITDVGAYTQARDVVEVQSRKVDNMTFALKQQNAILFLDELNAAPPSVQAAAYQLILNRRIGEYTLPPGVAVLAAGNRDTDKGTTYRMPTPLANRFIHYEMKHSFEDWQHWAVNNGVHADIVGFLSHHKQKLMNFDPRDPSPSFATPRSWVFLSNMLKKAKERGLSQGNEIKLIRGAVGDGLAGEFWQHRKIAAKMPRPEDVLTGRETKFGLDDVSAKYSLTVSMCYTLKEWYDLAVDAKYEDMDINKWHEAVDYFFRFTMDCFKTEMCVLGAKTALRDYQLNIDHRKLKNFTEFHEKYGEYILED